MSMNRTWAISSWIFLDLGGHLVGRLFPVLHAVGFCVLCSPHRNYKIETSNRIVCRSERLRNRRNPPLRPLGLGGTPSSKRSSFQGLGESHFKMLVRKRTREFQPRRFRFGIFLPATRPRIARRSFSRSAGLSASSLRSIASATVLA